MKVLNYINESFGFDKDSEAKDVARYMCNHMIYIVDLDTSMIPEKVKVAARNFLEKNDNYHSGYQVDAWEEFLNMDLEVLTKEPCEHKNVVIGNGEGAQIDGATNEVDLVIYCSDCNDDLFRISEHKRNIVNLSKHINRF